MNWGNKEESVIDLLLTIGTAIIVLGFIDLLELAGWHLIVAGVIITGIGVSYAMKNMREKGIVPDWKKKKVKRK